MKNPLKRALCLLLCLAALTLAALPAAGAVQIEDEAVPMAAGPAALETATHPAYIQGDLNGLVWPESTVTRQETAVMFYRLLTEASREVFDGAENPFPDVSPDHWANRAVSTLAAAGILKGLPDGTFGLERSITRGEFVVILTRFFPVAEGAVNPFPDAVGHWAEGEIAFAAAVGWISGYPDGNFGPDDPITRGEAMRIVNNALSRRADVAGLGPHIRTYPDNLPGKWYYYDVLEATNGHTFQRMGDGTLEEYWTGPLDQ